MARHYDFTIDAAKARKPQHKGKVERSVLIARQQLLAGSLQEAGLVKDNAYAAVGHSEKYLPRVGCPRHTDVPRGIFAVRQACLPGGLHGRGRSVHECLDGRGWTS